jgi:hypothetical protein
MDRQVQTWSNLRFQVSVNDALSVHEVDDVDQLSDVSRRLGFGEPFLPSDSVEQLAASEKLGDYVGVNVVLKKREICIFWVHLSCP